MIKSKIVRSLFLEIATSKRFSLDSKDNVCEVNVEGTELPFHALFDQWFGFLANRRKRFSNRYNVYTNNLKVKKTLEKEDKVISFYLPENLDYRADNLILPHRQQYKIGFFDFSEYDEAYSIPPHTNYFRKFILDFCPEPEEEKEPETDLYGNIVPVEKPQLDEVPRLFVAIYPMEIMKLELNPYVEDPIKSFQDTIKQGVKDGTIKVITAATSYESYANDSESGDEILTPFKDENGREYVGVLYCNVDIFKNNDGGTKVKDLFPKPIVSPVAIRPKLRTGTPKVKRKTV